jgi:hypothetical protein
MLISHHQNAGQNCSVKTNNKSLKNVGKGLGMSVTNQNSIHKEFKNGEFREYFLSFISESFVLPSAL